MIFYLLLTFCACWVNVQGEQFIECLSPDKQNTFVASQSSCSRYIFCDGENSFAGECLDDNFFNEAAGNCDDPKAVKCLVDNDVGAIAGVIEKTSTLSNTITTTTSASNPTKFESTTLKPTTNLDVSTTLEVSQTSATKKPSFGSSISDVPQCPRNVKGQSNATVYLPNPQSCDAYFICYYGIAIPMSCPEGNNFNALLGRCERQEEFLCALNRPARIHCVKGVYDLMPHPENCEYYYFCANGFLMIFQCPHQFMWHFERRTCVHRSLAKCYKKSNIYDLLTYDQYASSVNL